MYSYKDRIRAVRLYIKLGKSLAANFRQLGYPGATGTLERWHHAYEQYLDLPRDRICSKPSYSGEQKNAVTDDYLSHCQCLSATVTAVAYPGTVTLAGWLDELNAARKKRLTGETTGVRHAYEFQQHAVIGLCSRQESAQAVAQRIGVTRTTLLTGKNGYSVLRLSQL
jgi:transposase-like protein